VKIYKMMTDLGFRVGTSGGGCTSWSLVLADGRCVIVDSGDLDADLNAEVCVGVYSGGLDPDLEVDCLEQRTFDCFALALPWIQDLTR